MTGSGLSLLTIDTSALVTTVVPCVELSFPTRRSSDLLLTEAVSDRFAVCAELTFTVTLTEVLAPLARVRRRQDSGHLRASYTPPPVAETKVVPAGSGSEAVTPKASDGPLLLTARV